MECLKNPRPIQIHLVLIEEPEAHLHVQVQQVFMRKAYERLRSHDDLKSNSLFTTQLIVSTHSSYIANECAFSELRYFQRICGGSNNSIPESTVKNLATVFGAVKEKNSKNGLKRNAKIKQDIIKEVEGDTSDDAILSEQEKAEITRRFVARYLKTTHCDLFFADGVILFEGAGERMLLPHFLKKFSDGDLYKTYITLLEIGGSHAFRLQELVEFLGLPTLIITDIDSTQQDSQSHRWKKCPIRTGENQHTGNPTLKKIMYDKKTIDELLELALHNSDIIDGDDIYTIKTVYQYKMSIAIDDDKIVDIYPRTFEDALILANFSFFKNMQLDESALPQLFSVCEKINETPPTQRFEDALFEVINDENFQKAAFSLEILFDFNPNELIIPNYIEDGLRWLKNKILPECKNLQKKHINELEK